MIAKSLIINYFPFAKNLFASSKYDYGFIVHARDEDDIYRKIFWLKYLPSWVTYLISRFIWPVIVCEINGPRDVHGRIIRGVVIGVGMTAKMLMSHRRKARKKFISAANLAKKMGVKNLGLGALSSSLTSGGLDIQKKVDIGLTTGHALTVLTVIGHLVNISKLMGKELGLSEIAIVGAAGSIGSNSARVIAARHSFRRLLLIDIPKKNKELNDLVMELKDSSPGINVTCSQAVMDIKNSDFIITATNSPGVLIESRHLKSGAVIIDDAQPTDVSIDVFKTRKDILILEGGVVNFPELNINFNFGLLNKGDVFSCLGEVIILSIFNHVGSFNLGKLGIENIMKIEELSKEVNIHLGQPQNMFKNYSPEEIRAVGNYSTKK